MIEHGSIANLVQADLDEFALTPDDRVGQSSSPAYDSSVEETWLALSAGATVVVLDDETTRLGPDLVPWLRRERITVLCPATHAAADHGMRRPGDGPAGPPPPLRRRRGPAAATSPTAGRPAAVW